MTIVTKFKSGRVIEYYEVVAVDLNITDDYLYLWLIDGRIVRCRAHAVRYFIKRYSTGDEYTIYINKIKTRN